VGNVKPEGVTVSEQKQRREEDGTRGQGKEEKRSPRKRKGIPSGRIGAGAKKGSRS